MSQWKETEIGRIPNDWNLGIFNQDLTVKGRIGWKGYKTSDLVESGPFVLGGTEIKSSIFLDLSNAQHLSREKYDESPDIILKDGDILLVTRGNLGEVGYYWSQYGEATINPSVVILNNFVGDSKFLFYYLISKQGKGNILSLAGGSSVPAIYQADLKKIKYPKPPLYEQKKIAEVVFSIDDKIDLLNRQNKTLEQLAETLFRQWFVGEADESWVVGTLEDEFDFTMGQSPPGDSYNEIGDGIIFFQGRTDFDFRFPKTRMFTSQPSRYAKPFDTLVSVRAPVGDMNMAYTDCCIGRGLSAFRYRHNSTFYSYAYYKLRSLMQQIKQFEDNGTVFGSITKDDFSRLKNIIPTIELINNFQSKVKPVDEKIFSNYNQIRTLTQLRDTLLPKLMSGEVRVTK